MAERKPISKRVRFEVFKRDGFSCQYCGAVPPKLLEIDHITPVVEGGTNDEGNLLTACFDCNRGKGGIPLTIAPKTLSEKGAETVEREAQLAGYREVMEARADRIESDRWEVAEILVPGSAKEGMKRDWLRSIMIFNERLPLHEVKEAANLARDRVPFSERRRFLYFCKVCWNNIKEGGNGQD